MLEKILTRADVREFLHEVLNDDRFHDKVSPKTPEETSYPKTEYSLILMMDALIKYAILFDTDDLVDEYILQLRRFMKKCETEEDLREGINRTLGRITAVILKLELEEIEKQENKKKILAYIYERYITNGYVFHSFPFSYKNIVLEKGLDPLDYPCDIEGLKTIKEIFKIHGQKKILTKDLEDTAYITLTDSPLLAYHYAFSAPSYLSELVATSPFMENHKKYDRGAYYRREFQVAEKNVEQLCRDLELSNNESTIVLEQFVNEWKRLNMTTSRPIIAFIKRECVNHNYLKDYRKILDTCDKEELSYSIERILSPRIKSEKRYTPIAKENINLVELPQYREIYESALDFREEVVEKNENTKKEEMPERVDIRMEVVNTYGNASILALLGVLLIALGATITILLAIYKG